MASLRNHFAVVVFAMALPTILACGSSVIREPEPTENCLAEPVCDESDVEVAFCETEDCYEVSACGSTILCAPEDCEGLFDCDPGDSAVEGCPDDSVCYTVDVCGELIECIDDLLPAHGCPLSEPSGGGPCEANPPPDCTYPNGDDCFSAYSCEQGVWTFVGGGCSGG